MKLRSILALVAALHWPVLSFAQERPIRIVEPLGEFDIATRLALANPSAAARADYFHEMPKEILSQRAKTWIIVGAIVGGVLIIAGVLVLSKPGKKIFD